MGIGGPLRGYFLISCDLDKKTYITTNLLGAQFYYFIPPLLVISVLGSYTVKR